MRVSPPPHKCTSWQPQTNKSHIPRKHAVMANKRTWPLVLFVVLSIRATCVWAPVIGASVCGVCSNDDEGDIRLRYPATYGTSGQIQVCSSGYWQTVCSATSYEFTKSDSSVACWQLGFTTGEPAGTPGSGCKPEQDTFLVVNPPCRGWEEMLSDCNLNPVTAGRCTPQTAVSVACEGTVQVRLFHGNASSYLGKVMHYFNSSWRTVCDKNWTDKMSNSHVLCRQLGLGHALEHWLHDSGETDVHFLHTNIDCSGTEDKLRLCSHKFIMNDTCEGKSVPWVVCSSPQASDFNISSSFTSITLQWTVPNPLKYYPVVQEYNISYKEKEAENENNIIVPHDEQEVTLGGLKAGTQYRVTLQVIIKENHSGPETTFVVSTTGIPNADPRVTGLAIGLALCGVLLVCVVVVLGVIVVTAARRRRQHQDGVGYDVIPNNNPVQVPDEQPRNDLLAIEQ